MEIVKISKIDDIGDLKNIHDKLYVLEQNVVSKYLFVGENTTREQIFADYGVYVDEKYIYDGNVLYIDQIKDITHIVKPYETLYDIAKKYSVDELGIIKRNALTTTKLYVGQRLRI